MDRTCGLSRRHFIGGAASTVAAIGCGSDGSGSGTTGGSGTSGSPSGSVTSTIGDTLTTTLGGSTTGGDSTSSGTPATSGSDSSSTGPPLPDPIVDTHMHIWADDAQAYPFPHPYDAGFTQPSQDATVEMLVEDMDANGCSHCIVVQVIFHGWDNSYVRDSYLRYPDRFRVHGLIDPTDPDVADALELWMDQGLHGMRFSAIYYENGGNGGDAWLDAPVTHALWEKAEELGAAFNFFIAPSQVPRLGTMVADHQTVPVVIDHFARIKMSDGNFDQEVDDLLALSAYPNVYCKVSELNNVSGDPDPTYPYTDTWPLVQTVADAFGVDRLMWGTGYPGAARAAFGRPTLEEEMALVQELLPGFSDDDRAKILGRNAASVWGI